MDQMVESLAKNTSMSNTLFAYIMCGGGGTRLWPLSRADNPKQNLSLTTSHSMLDETITRFLSSDIAGVVSTVNLMGGASQIDAMGASLEGASGLTGSIILEPFGKNTAPAVALASLHAITQNHDPYVLILPSDHVIQPVEKFGVTIAAGLPAADDGQIVVFGIEPHSPATGYGYIEVADHQAVAPVQSFREKPDLETAKRYVKSGKHLWNAGIFLFRASTMLAALKKHAPEILGTCKATFENSPVSRDNFLPLNAELFANVPADSIDFAVMERADNVTVVRADFEWHDVGSFASLQNLHGSGSTKSTHLGDILSHECDNTLLHSEGPMIAAVGLTDMAVVATPDVVLVTPLDRAEDIRKIVDQLDKSGRSETKRTPWLAENGAQPGRMASTLKDWLMSQALPYWAAHGCDRGYGGFHEVLDFDGNPMDVDKRLRTMARQIFSYAKAVEMGWTGEALSVVQHGLTFLNDAPAEPLGGWGKTFLADSSPHDRTEDLYDHAFVLLALAQCRQVGIAFDATLQSRAFDFVDSLRVTTSDGGFLGYHEDGEQSLPRRSNPHMHLLEAFLAWYRATGESKYLARASEIVGLLQSHFFDRDNMLLGEAFDAGLNFTGGEVRAFEPGHHFEWARLLHDYAAFSNSTVEPEAFRLFANGKALGLNPVNHFAHDLVAADGSPDHQSSRCWVQTEYISILSTLSANGKFHLAFEAERMMERLWHHYIAPAPDGQWIDVVDWRGRPATNTVPASTFYHLINCIDVYLKTMPVK